MKKVLMLPEEKIDVGMAALAFAKEIYPDLDIAAYSNKLDVLAEQVRQMSKETKNPDQRIRCLNTVILLHEKYQGTKDLATARTSQMYYLNRVLDTKQGNCVSMPLLYIAVAERLGWPIYLVHVPDHSFVRYVDPALKEQNIEATSNGGTVSDEQYSKDFLVSQKGRKSGAYLRTLTHRELLGDLAAINGISFARQKKRSTAVAYLELATKLNPKNVAAWRNLAYAYHILAKHSKDEDAKKYAERIKVITKKLNELGFVDPKDIY
ncbi:MAG: transglutaminase family protein [Elusimicrobiota bacterium]